MRIAVCSDIHLEFGPISLENKDNADVLILSGDICVAKDLTLKQYDDFTGEEIQPNKILKFFGECSDRFPHVIYIMGNHEHYNGDFAKTHGILKDKLGHLKNLHILEKESVRINDVTFIGGTLWTDMNKEDSVTLWTIGKRMNDFRLVENSDHKVSFKVPIYENDQVIREECRERNARFTPEDAVEEHKKMLAYIKEVIDRNPADTYVVCGHHGPSKNSVHPKYKNDELMNGGYVSELEDFILNNPNIRLWTQGHTHEDFDYMIGPTRIVCNPRGYIGYERRAESFKLKTVEI